MLFIKGVNKTSNAVTSKEWMILKRRRENGEWGMGNGKWGIVVSGNTKK